MWVKRHEEASGEYVDPDLSAQVLGLPLPAARRMLAAISQPRIERPIGLLIWKLRDLEANPGSASAQPRNASTTNRAAAQAAETARQNPQPPAGASRLQSGMPLRRAAVGEASTFNPEQLLCMSCGKPCEYTRRVARAGGTAQPHTCHRFAKCACGCRTSVQENDLFPNVFHVQLAVPRPRQTATAGPGDTGAPSPVSKGPGSATPATEAVVDCVKCPTCAQDLTLILHDPVQHLFQTVEFSCGTCQDVYNGFVTVAVRTLGFSFVRRRST
jgi:hypothetical protein